MTLQNIERVVVDCILASTLLNFTLDKQIDVLGITREYFTLVEWTSTYFDSPGSPERFLCFLPLRPSLNSYLEDYERDHKTGNIVRQRNL